jgi:predicted ArsR family transcriptional regulator
MKAGEEKLTVACRILLHLSSLSRYQEKFVRPRGMTQQGMAEELGINRALASKELKRLTEDGRVKSELKHVIGTKRQKKTYFLTNLGERLAAELKQIAAGEATEGREGGVGGRPDGVRVLARKQATDR